VAHRLRDRCDHRIACDQAESLGAQDKDRTLAALFAPGLGIEDHSDKIPPIGDTCSSIGLGSRTPTLLPHFCDVTAMPGSWYPIGYK
jgi:hypothetical protein